MSTSRHDDTAAILRDLIVISRRGIADARSAAVSLNMTEQSILGYIVDHPGCRSVDIAAAYRLNRSTVSRQLARLVQLGVVREIADDERTAGRGRPLELTDAGWQAYRDALDLLQAVVDRHLDGWNDAEVARFAHDLGRFNAAS